MSRNRLFLPGEKPREFKENPCLTQIKSLDEFFLPFFEKYRDELEKCMAISNAKAFFHESSSDKIEISAFTDKLMWSTILAGFSIVFTTPYHKNFQMTGNVLLMIIVICAISSCCIMPRKSAERKHPHLFSYIPTDKKAEYQKKAYDFLDQRAEFFRKLTQDEKEDMALKMDLKTLQILVDCFHATRESKRHPYQLHQVIDMLDACVLFRLNEDKWETRDQLDAIKKMYRDDREYRD
ncbi:MAG: hypothetical protein ACYCQI_09930, partial [Gammaproteobacteria bacterium]